MTTARSQSGGLSMCIARRNIHTRIARRIARRNIRCALTSDIQIACNRRLVELLVATFHMLQSPSRRIARRNILCALTLALLVVQIPCVLTSDIHARRPRLNKLCSSHWPPHGRPQLTTLSTVDTTVDIQLEVHKTHDGVTACAATNSSGCWSISSNWPPHGRPQLTTLSPARLRLRAPHVDASVDASSPADISCSDNLCRHLSSSLGCGRQHLRLLVDFLRAFVCAHFLQHAQSATSLCWNVLTTCVLTLGCRLDVLL